MNQIIYKITSVLVITAHLLTVSLRDMGFAGEGGAGTGQAQRPVPTPGVSKEELIGSGGSVSAGELIGASQGGNSNVPAPTRYRLSSESSVSALLNPEKLIRSFHLDPSGAVNASIFGGDIGMGAAIGGFSAGFGEFLGAYTPFLGNVAGKGFDAFTRNLLARTAAGAIVGGVTSEIFGGKFGQGAQLGATTAAIGYTANHAMHQLELNAKARKALNTSSTLLENGQI